MATVTIQCANCRKRFVGMPSLKGSLGRAQIIKHAISGGWFQAGGKIVCSETCAANQALDITPQTKRLTQPPSSSTKGEG